jgi:predicted membrane protein
MIHTVKLHGGASCIFFIEIVLIGNFMLLNYFLAMLLKNVEESKKKRIEAEQIVVKDEKEKVYETLESENDLNNTFTSQNASRRESMAR